MTGEYEICQTNAAPDSLLSQTKELKFHLAPKVIAPAYYYKIENAIVTDTYVMDPSSPSTVFIETLPEISLFPHRLGGQLRYRNVFRCRFNRFFRKSKLSKAYLLSNDWWNNYYHFVTDVLLKYDAFTAAEIEGTEDLALLVHAEPSEWQKAYFELLGMSSDRFVSTKNKIFEIGELIVAGSRRERYWCSPNAIKRFKHTVLTRLGYPHIADKTHRKDNLIYISRASAKYRRVENEQQIVPILEERGFKVVRLEEMSVKEQILTFADARIVVAPHGAGLTNLMYSQDPTVVEFFPEDSFYQGFYITLTFACGGQHYPIVGQPIDDSKNYRIDPQKLTMLIDSLLW